MRPLPDYWPSPRGRLTTWMAREAQYFTRLRIGRVPRARIQVGPRGVYVVPLNDWEATETGGGREPRWG